MCAWYPQKVPAFADLEVKVVQMGSGGLEVASDWSIP